MNLPKPKMYCLLAGNSERIKQYQKSIQDHRLIIFLVVSFLFFIMAAFMLLLGINLRLTRARALMYYNPEDIEVIFKSDGVHNEMSINWFTLNRTATSMVWYGIRGFNDIAIGNQTKFADQEGHEVYFHHVRLQGLLPNANYKYKVGSDEVISPVQYFKTPSKHGIIIFDEMQGNQFVDTEIEKEIERSHGVFSKAKAFFANIEKSINDKIQTVFQRFNSNED